MKRRTAVLARELRSSGLAGVIIVPGPNLLYYTGVRAHLYERPFLFLVQSDGDAHLLAPRLEAGPFLSSIPMKVHAWTDNQGPSGAFRELLGQVDTKGTWGCEGRAPFGFLHHLLGKGLKVKPAEAILQSIREVKEPEEMELLKRSAAILSASILKVPEALHEGMTEKELSRFISEDALAGGADEVEPTVQSGARAADPHSVTSTRKIGRGESVVADVVSTYAGYAADITRTFVLGSDGEVEKTYESVLAAQQKAIDIAGAGVATGRVDAAARDSLERDGLAKYFVHRTGHGLGLEVHEAPYIVAGGRERLRAEMVFTVEPGVYIPGKLGVRIEDDVSISKGGRAEVTTGKVPKEYGWWRK
ncbi:MAG: M24 family metallopeptidase [Nitrososphaerales archaeon]